MKILLIEMKNCFIDILRLGIDFAKELFEKENKKSIKEYLILFYIIIISIPVLCIIGPISILIRFIIGRIILFLNKDIFKD